MDKNILTETLFLIFSQKRIIILFHCLKLTETPGILPTRHEEHLSCLTQKLKDFTTQISRADNSHTVWNCSIHDDVEAEKGN